MKVLVNAISARFGGIVTYTSNLASSFATLGLDATFAVSRQFPACGPVPLLRVPASGYSPLMRLAWEQTVWRSAVARHAPDILFSSANFALLRSPVPQVLLMREGGLFDPSYLVNVAPEQGVEAAILRYLRRRMMLWSARSADRLVTPTAAMRDLILRWVPQLADDISVNPYGTLIDRFSPLREPRPWRADGKLRLLYVSVYYPHKNPSLIVQAAEQLQAAGIETRARITMDFEEIRSSRGATLDTILIEKASRKGLVTLGRHDYAGLPDLYRSHDVFVFPSVSETFGHPMVEALSMAMPVVVADTAVNREICGDAALYFRPFSPGGLAEQLRRLDADPDLRLELRERSRRRAIEKFTWQSHVDRLITIFEETRRRL